LDFIGRVLKVTSDKRILWLESTRSLILGDVVPNPIQLKYSMEADHTRLVFQSARPVGYATQMQGGIFVITLQGEDFTIGFQETSFTDGILKSLSVAGAARKSIRIETDQSYESYKSFELTDPPRLVIDFFRKKQQQAGEAAPASKEAAPPVLLPESPAGKRVIVIDPGHGGTETGAIGRDGMQEKDITLSIARKLKSVLENNSGTRVILTRDGDQVVPLDDRTSLANNNKADLFISIHLNSTLRGLGKGAETYFLSAQASDDEARNAAAVENNAVGVNQDAAQLGSDLKLILWDMAQTEYLTESSHLAETIQQELNDTLGITNRGIKQAPFRVLMGATMPAVLVEVGFINNPAEEKLLNDSEYQMKIARAIFRSVQSFQSNLVHPASPLPSPGR
ncbi:MAG TPA: N-acetylmuramoyl-L-alanine amidase, partial [Acidobacteriota bacterium]|nr:N-acetylmuramoyl-L-alanine amidase [Acidobacteriota bacterium]